VICIITTGGTIASLPRANGDVIAVLEGDELLRNQRNSESIRINNVTTLGSFAFTYNTLYEIAQHVQTALMDDTVEGIVITHGTDTLEETSFFLSLVCNRSKPIVLTGAQLDASHPSSDGHRNLMDAVCVARFKQAANWGPVVVFGGYIYAAREARKVDTNGLEAFAAPGWGPLGRVDQDRVIVARTLTAQPLLQPAIPKSVALIRLCIGMTGDEIAQLANGYKGLVIQAFGRGNAHPSVSPEVQGLVSRGIPVVITSRCISGAVAPVYGNGGGRDLERAGAWFAGDLSGEKARLLLGLLLTHGTNGETSKSFLLQWGNIPNG
jgi:L-asparaginase